LIQHTFEVRQDYRNLDIAFVIDTEILLLKCYYEKKEGTAFMDLIASFRRRIRDRANLTSRQINGFGNFLKFIKELYWFKIGISSKSLPALVERIKNTNPNNDKRWLLAKAAELE